MEIDRTEYVMSDEAGRIIGFGSVPSSMFEHQLPPQGGALVVGTGDAESHWVQDGAIVARPPNTALIHGLALTRLPVPCTIVVDGMDHACDSDHCELSFSSAGTYAVVVRAFPMVDAHFEVTQS